MLGSLITRALIMVLGYAYPAYECYKTVELNKPEIEQLLFWCQYWILIAVLTVLERIGDTLISWLPMYGEAKVAFIVYLWYPRTRGSLYIYDSFFRPFIAKYETEIDRNLLELRTRAGDMIMLYCQRAVSYGQIRFSETLQYVVSQSQAPKTSPVQRQQPPEATRRPPSVPPPAQPARPPQTSQQPRQLTRAAPIQEEPPTKAAPAAHPQTSSDRTIIVLPPTEEPKQVDAADSSAVQEFEPPEEETVIEDANRTPRAKLRKRH
ncbi:putative HVA22-like protein g [Typha latifolia]|uniref:putative HVA22-like protein g n=1 Tax=Typha latifolia TaxID=4733 RepID=UPI003C2F32FC